MLVNLLVYLLCSVFVGFFSLHWLFHLIFVINQARLNHSKGHHSNLVDIKPIVVEVEEFLFTSLVPKLVKHFVVVFLPEGCLYDSVQVLLGDNSLHPIAVGSHLYIDQLLARLQSPSELEVEAPRHQDNLDKHNVNHVRPAHTRL